MLVAKRCCATESETLSGIRCIARSVHRSCLVDVAITPRLLDYRIMFDLSVKGIPVQRPDGYGLRSSNVYSLRILFGATAKAEPSRRSAAAITVRIICGEFDWKSAEKDYIYFRK